MVFWPSNLVPHVLATSKVISARYMGIEIYVGTVRFFFFLKLMFLLDYARGVLSPDSFYAFVFALALHNRIGSVLIEFSGTTYADVCISIAFPNTLCTCWEVTLPQMHYFCWLEIM